MKIINSFSMYHDRPLKFPLLAVTFLSLIATSFIAHSDTSTLRKGHFLIATDVMEENGFSKSVIYVTQAGKDGTYGLIINRPTELAVKELIPHASKISATKSVYFGGPMHARFLFILAETTNGHDLHAVDQNIYFGAGPSVTSHLEEKSQDLNVRTYAGFSSWPPGQLEAEIAKGDWLVVPAATKNLFDTKPEDLWLRLYKLWSGNWI